VRGAIVDPSALSMTKFPEHIEDNLYRTIVENVVIVCVDIILTTDENSFLLLRRVNEPAKGEWWLPGGRINKGETVEQAFRRKLKQELSLEGAFVKIVSVEETIFDKSIGSPHTINIVGHMQVSHMPLLSLDNQHDAFKWCRNIPRGLHPAITNPLRLMGYSYEG